ncbi:fork head domain protein, putative [Plasmodium ovale]|uniref:Fork head domain protein, putative n=1 Tax=Plasmodium ovale TaxID=36330 RepID=A0A1D3U9B8_PLAOA|nr:fork head domain protein, putative [Plasmodium ovale]
MGIDKLQTLNNFSADRNNFIIVRNDKIDVVELIRSGKYSNGANMLVEGRRGRSEGSLTHQGELGTAKLYHSEKEFQKGYRYETNGEGAWEKIKGNILERTSCYGVREKRGEGSSGYARYAINNSPDAKSELQDGRCHKMGHYYDNEGSAHGRSNLSRRSNMSYGKISCYEGNSRGGNYSLGKYLPVRLTTKVIERWIFRENITEHLSREDDEWVLDATCNTLNEMRSLNVRSPYSKDNVAITALVDGGSSEYERDTIDRGGRMLCIITSQRDDCHSEEGSLHDRSILCNDTFGKCILDYELDRSKGRTSNYGEGSNHDERIPEFEKSVEDKKEGYKIIVTKFREEANIMEKGEYRHKQYISEKGEEKDIEEIGQRNTNNYEYREYMEGKTFVLHSQCEIVQDRQYIYGKNKQGHMHSQWDLYKKCKSHDENVSSGTYSHDKLYEIYEDAQIDLEFNLYRIYVLMDRMIISHETNICNEVEVLLLLCALKNNKIKHSIRNYDYKSGNIRKNIYFGKLGESSSLMVGEENMEKEEMGNYGWGRNRRGNDGRGSNRRGGDGREKDRRGGDERENDRRRNDERENDRRGGDERENDRRRNDERENDRRGGDERENDRRRNDERENDRRGGDERENDRRRNDERENDRRGGDERENDRRRNDERENDRRGGDERENDRRRNDERENDRRGGDERENDRRRNDERENDRRGGDERENDRRRNDERENDRRGGDERENDRRRNDERENDRRGNDGRGSNRRGGDGRENDRRGGDGRENDRRGNDEREKEREEKERKKKERREKERREKERREKERREKERREKERGKKERGKKERTEKERDEEGRGKNSEDEEDFYRVRKKVKKGENVIGDNISELRLYERSRECNYKDRDNYDGKNYYKDRHSNSRNKISYSEESSSKKRSNSDNRGRRDNSGLRMRDDDGSHNRDDDDCRSRKSNAGAGNEKKEWENGNKEMQNFNPSGLLAQEKSYRNGVELKYTESIDGENPDKKWRLYMFLNSKTNDPQDIIHIHEKSWHLIGKDELVADIKLTHISISKQHAVIQFKKHENKIVPFLIDLNSTNGSYLNHEKIDPNKFYELRECDLLKFGKSGQEFVLIHEEHEHS